MLTIKSEVVPKVRISTSLHIPNQMPDELFQGYYGRLLKVNGIENPTIGNLYINDAIKHLDADLQKRHAIFKIAILIGVPAHEFINRHTLIPVLRSPTSIRNKQNDDPNIVNKLVSRLPKKEIHLCKECVKEDVAYLGFSFWRKSHQFLGIDWCSKHDTALCVALNINSVYKQPSKIILANEYREFNANKSDRENRYVKKFNELYQDYSDSHHTINAHTAAKYFKEKAQALSLRTCANGVRKNLSDLLVESLPEQWLKNHFSELVKSYQGEYLNSFDYVTSAHGNGSKISSILIAAAVLGQDDDQVLSKLTSDIHFNKPANKLSDDDLISCYIEHGGQLSEIENKLGVNSSLLARRLNALGCPTLKNLNKSSIIALKAFYKGQSLDQISKIKGININEFMDTLRIGSLNLGKALNYTA